MRASWETISWTLIQSAIISHQNAVYSQKIKESKRAPIRLAARWTLIFRFLSLKQPQGFLQRSVFWVEAAPKRCTVRSDPTASEWVFSQVEFMPFHLKRHKRHLGSLMCAQNHLQLWIKLGWWQRQVMGDRDPESNPDRYSHSSVARCDSDVLLSAPLRTPNLKLHPFLDLKGGCLLPVGEDSPVWGVLFQRSPVLFAPSSKCLMFETGKVKFQVFATFFGNRLECLVSCTHAARRLKAVWQRSVDVSLPI